VTSRLDRDDDHDDYYYFWDYDGNSETTLVFRGMREGLHGHETDEQLVEWVLRDGLGLRYSECVEKIERFGKDEGRPICVQIKSAEKYDEIMNRKTSLCKYRDFFRMYIQPFPNRQRLKQMK